MLSRMAVATISTTSVNVMPTSEMAVKTFRRASTRNASLRLAMFMSCHLPSVEKADRAAGLLRETIVVRDHHHGRSVLLVQLLENAHDLVAHGGVEIAGRLVGEHDARLSDDGARDGDALLLAAGELRRKVMNARRKSDAIERRQREFLPLAGCDLAIQQRDLHVVEHRQIRDEVEALEHEAELLVAHLRQRAVAGAIDVHA